MLDRLWKVSIASSKRVIKFEKFDWIKIIVVLWKQFVIKLNFHWLLNQESSLESSQDSFLMIIFTWNWYVFCWFQSRFHTKSRKLRSVSPKQITPCYKIRTQQFFLYLLRYSNRYPCNLSIIFKLIIHHLVVPFDSLFACALENFSKKSC